MLADEDFIQRAGPGQVGSMLYYCPRGERLRDGLREPPLKGGRVVALLGRPEAARGRT